MYCIILQFSWITFYEWSAFPEFAVGNFLTWNPNAPYAAPAVAKISKSFECYFAHIHMEMAQIFIPVLKMRVYELDELPGFWSHSIGACVPKNSYSVPRAAASVFEKNFFFTISMPYLCDFQFSSYCDK